MRENKTICQIILNEKPAFEALAVRFGQQFENRKNGDHRFDDHNSHAILLSKPANATDRFVYIFGSVMLFCIIYAVLSAIIIMFFPPFFLHEFQM